MFWRTTIGVLMVGLLVVAGCIVTEDTESAQTARIVLSVTATAPGTLEVGDEATLAASTTDAPEDATLTYSWFQTGGPGISLENATSASAGLVAPSLATTQVLLFMVTVNDGGSGVGRAEVEIAVRADPDYGKTDEDDDDQDIPAPVADAGADQEVYEGDDVTLSASGSTGLGLSYEWSQINGSTIELAETGKSSLAFSAPSFVTGADNTYEFEVTVTDVFGESVSDSAVVTVVSAEEITGEEGKTLVRVRTSLGNFVIQLEDDLAPITVANFLQYVDDDFFDGTIFHRVIADFMVQGGGFLPSLEKKDTRDPIELEADNGLENDRGMVAMARTSDPDSATAQFYVNVVDNDSLNADQSPPGYTVFGTVIQGMTVVDAIAAVDTGTRDSFEDVPIDDVDIIEILRVVDNSTSSGG